MRTLFGLMLAGAVYFALSAQHGLSFLSAMAYTPELCSGVVLRTTPVYGTYSSMDQETGLVARAGTTVDGLVSLLLDTRTGLRRYCDLRGGGCYPVDAIRLLNCSVSRQARQSDPAFGSDSIVIYDTVLNRSATNQTALRASDVEGTLIDRFGLCHACAGNAAYHYVREPNSACGRLVRAALEGDPVATKRLQGAEVCWR